ncbi:MAG: Rrf2 family transcriptional regulator [Actinobacteria bacterium]|nr:Rrf2 family transcriptional regulator [Actinomycetota bacterium]
MHVTAKADYAVRAMIEIAAADGGRSKAGDIAEAQDIPLGFLRGILTDLRRAGLIVSQRSANGGFRLARDAAEISIGDVIRSVEGPLAQVRGLKPTELAYEGSATPLRDVWIALRCNLRAILDNTTIADVASGTLPDLVVDLAADPKALIENF